ncbi:MAG TPA: UPF0182 family protein, partial [Candidatus Sericytochromatia bacterium]
MNWKRPFQLVTVLLGIGLLLDLVCRLGAEVLWFQEVAYLSVFLLKFQVRLVLFVVVAGFTAVYLLGNLVLAQRLQTAPTPTVHDSDGLRSKARKPSLFAPYVLRSRTRPPSLPSSAALGLRSLLPLVLGLSVLVGLLLLYYGQ